MTVFLLDEARSTIEAWCHENIGDRFYEDRDALRWDCLPITGVIYNLGRDINGMVGDTWKVMIDDETLAVLFKLNFGHAERL